MKSKILFIALFFFMTQAYCQKEILFFQTGWGNKLSWDLFCERVKTSGFDGIDVWMPTNKNDQIELKNAILKYNLYLNLMHGTDLRLPFEESLKLYTDKLKFLITCKPYSITSHTGSDFFTQEQNEAFINIANKLSKASNIPIYHETHRQRFSYNLKDTLKYLEAITDLKLTLDISHWMVVHESLLENQDHLLKEVIKRSDHIHARVGYAEGPQVSDPEAPEWKKSLDRHLDIWEKVIQKGWQENNNVFSVTTEFGPPGYMHTLPFTNLPVADQWKTNVFIMKAIKERMKIN